MNIQSSQPSGLNSLYPAIQAQSERGLCLERVKANGLDLESASDALKADREIVLAAVEQNGLALQYASDELKNDREFA